ncbi:hypothetical protein C1645_809315 [Glomus cerebriforme]|uniref:Uncharacterized protein n=1 Tax=Glomus cerebriforme TaxID=658196 RepID=A0A397SKX9_9GLOM|nr:hypothetical protein C1645_809315 [Glomus cerebriforme]
MWSSHGKQTNKQSDYGSEGLIIENLFVIYDRAPDTCPIVTIYYTNTIYYTYTSTLATTRYVTSTTSPVCEVCEVCNNSAIIGTSVPLGIIGGVMCISLIFYYRKKSWAQKNTAAGIEPAQLGQIPRQGLVSIVSSVNNKSFSSVPNNQSNQNHGSEYSYDNCDNFTKEIGAQEVVNLNKKALEDLDEEIIVLEKQKRVVELKKEIRDLEGVKEITSTTNSIYSD